MSKESFRPLKVFLCHASGDKPQVRALYRRLTAEGVDAWLDQEKLLPGQDWRVEIPRAVREADVVVVCLSNKSITKEGYIQKEIKFALDSADEKPEGTIFLIPARLEECIVPEQVGRWQWVDLYEENGFIRLLRSLKLRADKVGAVIQQSSYEDEDAETERRLEQLYTEGLEAFYTENWDRAYQRFQLILSERPNHVGAAEKLEEAERQRNLAKLYIQSMEAYNSENWQVAVRILEELSQRTADYKDVAQLLGNARKQKQLKELYIEAKKLHAAKKWQAVLKVFDQISIVDSSFSDSNGLLASAQKEVTELKRLADLNDLYGQAVRKMDVGQWYEAHKLLKQIHEDELGFLETERLLAKVEIEVKKVEEKKQREDQINNLYEQARGLFRSQMLREALSKLEEIRKLDEQFADPDQIAKQAQVEIEHKEQEIERHNKLTAMYAESVRLLRERKYQDALEAWQEIVNVDPRYPDQHKVQITSKKKLAELTKSLQSRPRVVNLKQVGIASSLVIMLAIFIWGSFRFLPVLTGIINSPTPSPLVAGSPPLEKNLTSADYGEVMYVEEFSNAQRWELEGSRVENGNLILGPDVAAYPFKFDGEPPIFTDFIFESQFSNPESSPVMSFYLRFQNTSCSNCSIQVAINFYNNTIVGRRVRGATAYEDITSDKSIQIDQMQWNKITIKVEGNNYEVYMNDAFIMNFTDDTYVSGAFVLDNGSKEVKVAYVRIYDLP